MGALERFTRDVDVTVALDLDEFARLIDRLITAGWNRASKLEHRWVAPRETFCLLVPISDARDRFFGLRVSLR